MSSRSAAAGKIAPRTMARTRPSTIGSHRSEEHTSELQSQSNLVCRLLLEKKKIFDVLRAFSAAMSRNNLVGHVVGARILRDLSHGHCTCTVMRVGYARTDCAVDSHTLSRT